MDPSRLEKALWSHIRISLRIGDSKVTSSCSCPVRVQLDFTRRTEGGPISFIQIMTDQPERVTHRPKFPAITLGFWIIKILATTLGETGGDSVTMTWLGETTPDPVAEWLPGWHRDLRGALVARSGPDPCAAVQPVALLGDDRCLHHLRHDLCRFCSARSGSAIRAGRFFCWPACSASLFAWHRAMARRVNTIVSRGKRPSTGSRSPFRRRSAPRSATGSPDAGTRLSRWRPLFGGALAFSAVSISRRDEPCLCSGRRSS